MKIESYDYKTVVYKKTEPTKKTICFFTEKVKGQTYGYDAYVEEFDRLNKLYPNWAHEVVKSEVLGLQDIA